jgi:hypothetical protein
MANIKITELRPAGIELFQDSESFLNELGEQETLTSGGRGRRPFIIVIASRINVISQLTISIGISINSISAVSRLNR